MWITRFTKLVFFWLLKLLLTENGYRHARENIRAATERVARRRYAGRLKALLDSPPWWIDSVEVSTDSIAFSGWALAPKGKHEHLSFTVDGRPCEHIDYRLPREDVGRVFWYLEDSERSGFSCRARYPRESASSRSHALFQCIDRSSGKPFDPNSSYYYYHHHGSEPLPLPDSERISKIQGNGSENMYTLLGSTAYRKLELALQDLGLGNYENATHILDWGCGCGRLTRHFHDLANTRVTGADIDSDNVDWCSAHLPFARFTTTAKHPPTPFEDSSFDLLIGLSVFTHLREEDQFKWLEELKRLAAPNAILLMTVHGSSTFCASTFNRTLFKRWQNRGFLDIGENPDLESAFPDDDYYRNTFHTSNYIQNNWSRYFDIVKILPGYIGHQDLVIMKKDLCVWKRFQSITDRMFNITPY